MGRRKLSIHKWDNDQEIRRLLESGRYSFGQIGRRLGLSGERVRQIHDRLYPDDRWAARRRAIRAAALQPKGGWSPSVLYVWQEAERRGLQVAKIISAKGSARRGAVKINGKPVVVARTRSVVIPGETKQRYHMIAVPRIRVGPAWVIVSIRRGRRRLFIIPWDAVAKRNRIYIPLDRWSGYNNHRPITDWLKYRDNWRPFLPRARSTGRPTAG